MQPLSGDPMKSITVKNIPADIYESLKNSAKMNRRSINSEIIMIIEAAVHCKKIVPEDFIVTARQLREKTAAYVITDEEFNQAKRTGRL
jgi:plasmid stability protein